MLERIRILVAPFGRLMLIAKVLAELSYCPACAESLRRVHLLKQGGLSRRGDGRRLATRGP